MSIRVAVILIFVASAGQAQDNPIAFNKAFITVTNKGDFDLSLNLTLNPTTAAAPLPTASGSVSNSEPSSAQTASNNVAQFQIQKTVKPQQQITFSIPKGDYIVETITAPQPDQETVRQLPHPSNERTNQISNNEVWTFELEKEPQQSPAGDSQPAGESLASHTWKRHIWPVRQPRVPEAKELGDPAGALRVEPAGLTEPSSPKPIPAPPQNLRIIPQ